ILFAQPATHVQVRFEVVDRTREIADQLARHRAVVICPCKARIATDRRAIDGDGCVEMVVVAIGVRAVEIRVWFLRGEGDRGAETLNGALVVVLLVARKPPIQQILDRRLVAVAPLCPGHVAPVLSLAGEADSPADFRRLSGSAARPANRGYTHSA